MTSVLVIENSTDLESLYALNLRLYVGIEDFECKKKATYAINYLKDDHTPKVIICRLTIGQEKSAELVYAHLQNSSPNIPMIIIGPPSTALSGKHNIQFIPMGFNVKPLLQAVAKILNVTAKSMVEKKVEEYFPIPINYFLNIRNCVCDIYGLDINKVGSYINLFSKKLNITSAALKELISHGNSHLYVNQYDRLKFTNNVTFVLTEKLNLDTLDENDQLYISEVANQQLANQLKTVGITLETSKLAKKNMDIVAKSATRSSSLAGLMKKLMSNQSSYLFKHVQILTYVTHQMMQHMDWANEEQERTLAFMAYFHDIVLETDQQAMIHSKVDLQSAGLPDDERKLVESHAQQAADLVTGFKEAPHGIGTLIRQHHGVMNGLGFTNVYTGNISPLTIIFIIAEEYTRQLLMFNQNDKIDVAYVMDILKQTFKSHRFAKILAALEKIVIFE